MVSTPARSSFTNTFARPLSRIDSSLLACSLIDLLARSPIPLRDSQLYSATCAVCTAAVAACSAKLSLAHARSSQHHRRHDTTRPNPTQHDDTTRYCVGVAIGRCGIIFDAKSPVGHPPKESVKHVWRVVLCFLFAKWCVHPQLTSALPATITNPPNHLSFPTAVATSKPPLGSCPCTKLCPSNSLSTRHCCIPPALPLDQSAHHRGGTHSQPNQTTPHHSIQSGPAELTSPLPSSPTLYQSTFPVPDETHDHDPRFHDPPFVSSLQRQQQAAEDFLRTQHNLSRVSSSSPSSQGSEAPSPHPNPNLQETRPSFGSPSPLPQRAVRFAESSPPAHPALRISRRTASAIRFVLEEALRVPHSFTPDLVEETASMADLGGNGRAANGGARAGGPVPVTQSDRPNIRTPQMIMNERRQREARREADARAAEEQRIAEEERRRSAERRVQAAGVAGTPMTTSDLPSQRPIQVGTGSGGEGYSNYPPTAGGTQRQPERVVPVSTASSIPPVSNRPQDTTSGAQHRRPRANSQSQQQPQPVQQPALGSAGETRRPPATQHSRRPSVPVGSSQAGPSTAAPPSAPQAGSSSGQARQSTTSTFPHAFERWETLSSHWEGLTSYWIRKIEQSTDEGRRDPLNTQYTRQINDLSAAGANLFHAVVELQRLRASSERKFQRWFYEHRQEQERAQEREAQLENALRVEREARTVSSSDFDRIVTEKKNAERMVQEMRRELQISKEEARRAWEELGRREQEERDRTFSLRDGQPTVIGGVQVVPMAQGMGRHGSVSQRSHGGDDAYAGTSGSQSIEQQYSYEGAQSPTDTDPFTEGRHRSHAQHEPDVSMVGQGAYVPSGAAASSSRQPSASRPTEQSHVPAPLHPQRAATSASQPSPQLPTSSQPEAFYKQPEAYLHRESITSMPEDEMSGVASHGDVTSEGDEEYAIDEYGNYILDTSGHRVPFRALRQEESDEFDVQEARRRELEHLQRYGTAASDPSRYATTSSAGPTHQGHATSSAPDYSGSDYGSEWVNMRHHHPTRLSDVMEEDERSRTSPSRASQTSRGIF
ncbi:unnamed protein product [Periconia digitata]|uniref:Uncharacterized protein n=1 Tax=Periconia digitata TaxID=1303443 RepID=A0A9W4UJD2_9PLEO|nr:unnamed protein product [Periconia digitata]